MAGICDDSARRLYLLKKALRIDYDSEDEYLAFLLEAAEDHCIAVTERTPVELLEMGDGTNYPKALSQAIITLATHFYEEPSAMTSAQQTNQFGVDRLLSKLRKLSE